ncbi:MAG: LamG domain-containing protein, partial [Victivallales bacterium]
MKELGQQAGRPEKKRNFFFLIYVFLIFITSASPEDAAVNAKSGITRDLIFYQGFDAPAAAYLQGNPVHRFVLDTKSLVEGKYGKGYKFEPAYENLLKEEQASPSVGAKGFTTEPSVTLRVDTVNKFKDVPTLIAKGGVGVLWQTVPVELSNVEGPTRDFKAFLGSVYLRAATPGIKVRLEVVDEVESTDWKKTILDGNAVAEKKNPKAKIKAPFETRSEPKEIPLTSEWQRVTAGLSIDVRRPGQRLVLRLMLLEPSSAEVEASALQLEQYQKSPDLRNFAGPWIPGGTRWKSNRLLRTLAHVGFSGAAGTISCWTRSFRGTVMALGGGWGQPVWSIGSGPSYAGDAGREKYKAGKSVIPFPWEKMKILGDGAWHHLVLTWEKETCALYLDGVEIGRANYLYIEPKADAPLALGLSTLQFDHASGFVDEMAIWRRSLSVEEIKQVAGASGPLIADLSRFPLERPPRLASRGGEKSVNPFYVEMVASF